MRHISKTTLVTILNAVVAVICLFAFLVGQANAVWYEATGQAVVRNGDKETARHAATQEALKQAMLLQAHQFIVSPSLQMVFLKMKR